VRGFRLRGSLGLCRLHGWFDRVLRIVPVQLLLTVLFLTRTFSLDRSLRRRATLLVLPVLLQTAVQCARAQTTQESRDPERIVLTQLHDAIERHLSVAAIAEPELRPRAALCARLLDAQEYLEEPLENNSVEISVNSLAATSDEPAFVSRARGRIGNGRCTRIGPAQIPPELNLPRTIPQESPPALRALHARLLQSIAASTTSNFRCEGHSSPVRVTFVPGPNGALRVVWIGD
jgi:hypothetical protein